MVVNAVATVPTALPGAGPARTASSSVMRMIEQPVRQQKVLRAIEQRGRAIPQLLRLIDERRNDQQSDEGQNADDGQIDHQDGEPARQAAGADRNDPLMLDRVHQRREANRQQHADVDEQQHLAREIQRPDDDHRQRRQDDGAADCGR